MTSHKQIILGFLFIALGFGFLVYALPELGSNLIAIANTAHVEQRIGIISLILGVIIGAVGCFRKDKPMMP